MHLKKGLNFIGLSLILMIVLAACAKKETAAVISNQEASLSSIDFEYNGSIFNTLVSGNNINLSRVLPYGVTKATVKNIYLAENCTANIKAGDVVNVSNNTTYP